MFIFRNKPTFLQSISTWLLWLIVIITIVVYCSVFSILEMYVYILRAGQYTKFIKYLGINKYHSI